MHPILEQLDSNNESAKDRAHKVLPAGTFGNYEADVCISHGAGAHVWDTQGREFVDLLIGSGPMLLGHAHPEVNAAMVAQLQRGTTFFATNPAGIALAEEIRRAVECVEQVRFVSTGGEADMYAMRLARAYTKRDKILKFEGGYHGMSDPALMSLFPTAAPNYPHADPSSAGLPASTKEDMLIAPFNDLDFVESLLKAHAGHVAAIIVEPQQRVVPPAPGFLQGLRMLCDRYEMVLIFDEVVTGFRLAYGGAQERYAVQPDLCTLGKIIGGGLPLAAVGGAEKILQHFDPKKVGADGFTLQIGTLSGNPLAAVAGLQTMQLLAQPGQYDLLRANGQRIIDSYSRHLSSVGVPFTVVGEPELFDVVFTDQPVNNYRDTISGNHTHAKTMNLVMRECGVLKSPTKVYPSLALSDADFALIDDAIAQGVRALR